MRIKYGVIHSRNEDGLGSFTNRTQLMNPLIS